MEKFRSLPVHEKPHSVTDGNSKSNCKKYASAHLVQSPLPLQEFVKSLTTNTSMLVESLLAPCVFRKHLQLTKNEERVLIPLQKFSSLAVLSQPSISISHDHFVEDLRAVETTRKSSIFGTAGILLEEQLLMNSISFEDVVAQPDICHNGKILMCTNLALPVLSYVNGSYYLNTVVQGANNGKISRLEVPCNDIYEADLFATACKKPYIHSVTPGSLVLVRDPTFQIDSSRETFSIRVEKAHKVTFLGQCDIPSKPQNETDVSSVDKRSNKDVGNHSGYSTSDTEAESDDGEKSEASLWIPSSICEYKSARDEWKEWADEHALRRCHFKALIAYNIALFFDQASVELKSAKCAALINLGLFSAALIEINALAAHEPLNFGIMTRKIHCLWGLGRYDEAVGYLQEFYNDFISENTSPEEETFSRRLVLQKLLSKTETMINDSGLMSETYFKNSSQIWNQEPDYYDRVSFRNTKDNRQITIVNQDVSAGSLLVKTKAFTVVFSEDTSELINLTLQKFMVEKPTEFGVFDEDDTRMSWQSFESSRKKILEFREKNTYSMQWHDNVHALSGTGTITVSSQQPPSSKTIQGVWTLPARIKHSCVGGNAVWFLCGNLMLIRAICAIRKGEEVVMAHVEPTKPYESRAEFFKKKGMECSCSLCQFDKSEQEEVKQKRNKILDTLNAFSSQTENPLWMERIYVTKLKPQLENLELPRSAFPQMNFPIVEPLTTFGLHLMKSGNFDDAISLFERAFFVLENTAALATLVDLSVLLSYCCVVKTRNSDKNKAKKWFNTTKVYANLCFGSLTPIRHKFKAQFDYLKSRGIS